MRRRILFCITAMMLLSSSISFAHPGRTDSNGGHYVRTSGWGYPIGSYHYHNGGGSSSGGNDYYYTESKAEYDKGYSAGSKKGYQMGYAENYDTVNYTSSSHSYEKGFSAGYDEGFNKGIEAKRALRAKQQEEAYKKGYDFGASTKTPSSEAPSYSGDSILQRSYIRGYNDGVKILLENDYKTGVKDGKDKYMESCPKYSEDAKRQSNYERGYFESQNEAFASEYLSKMPQFEKEIYNTGYAFAFENETLEVPDTYSAHFENYMESINIIKLTEYAMNSLRLKYAKNETLVEAFKRGYSSNTEIASIKHKALKDGILLQKGETPEKGQKIYKEYYDAGKKGSVISLGTLSVAGTTGFVIKKKKKRQ